VDYASSFAYADSLTDLGLFEIVGNPRPVYPAADLREYARRQGWAVYEGGGMKIEPSKR
jgi:phosphoserine phosphatase